MIRSAIPTTGDRWMVRHLVPIGLLGAGLVAALLTYVAGIELALLGVAAICVTAVMTTVAYRYPTLVVLLTFFMGVARDDLRRFHPFFGANIQAGGALLRPYDLVMLGIVLATLLKLLDPRWRPTRFFVFLLPSWVLVTLWVFGRALHFSADYSPVNTLGEFRTYYQYFFVLPYIVAFVRTEAQQWRLFRFLTIASLFFILVGVANTVFLTNFRIGPRWLTSWGNLALLHGVIALFVGLKFKTFQMRTLPPLVVTVVYIVITLISSIRSVWIATSVAILMLLAVRTLSIARLVQISLGVMIALVVAGFWFSSFSIDGDLAEFVERRSVAFTGDFEDDGTARWRYTLWLQAIEEIRANPIAGVGFGRHFRFIDDGNRLVTTSPHNIYITIAYHTGVTGLVLYVALILQLVFRFRRALVSSLSAKGRTMVMTALIILLSSSAFYVAYVFDFSTWLYLSLGVAALFRERTPSHASPHLSPQPSYQAPPSPKTLEAPQ